MQLPPLAPCHHMLPAEEFGTTPQLLDDIGQGDSPVALMLTCWELGGAPDQLSHANSGEIMIVQNPGGLIPAADVEDDEAYLDSIFYCLNQSTVRHLIVCGHTECKTLALLLAEDKQQSEKLFCTPMEGVRTRFIATYQDRPARDWLGLVVQESVLQQLANLRSHSDIELRLRNGQLLLHGWIRDDQTATITTYDAASGQFRE